jgi:hypothetical protein
MFNRNVCKYSGAKNDREILIRNISEMVGSTGFGQNISGMADSPCLQLGWSSNNVPDLYFWSL